MRCLSLNGVFVAGQLCREVSRWSAEETTAGKAGPELSFPHFPLDQVQENLLWVGVGESRWEPALFYFRNVFLVELILWKISVSGVVCLCRPLRLAAGCQVPWVCKEAQPDMFSVQGPHSGDPLIFPSLPSSLRAAAAWKLIPQPLAFGRRTLPSYGKVFNTNLIVCLATVCPEPALLP